MFCRFLESLASKKWQERREAIEEVEALVKEKQRVVVNQELGSIIVQLTKVNFTL